MVVQYVHAIARCIRKEKTHNNAVVVLTVVRKGERIAQLICERICHPDLEQCEVTPAWAAYSMKVTPFLYVHPQT